jgi:hypothetical protein
MQRYSVIIHALAFLERFPEALLVYEQMLSSAVERSDEGNAPIDASNILSKVLIGLGRENDVPAYIDRAIKVFPSKTAALRQISSNAGTEKLQEECWKWVFNHQKDFVRGRDMFARLVSFKPQDFWANLIYGACLTITGSALQGEGYIRTAKKIDGKIPHGFVSGSNGILSADLMLLGRYSILAQNLKAQLRNQEAVEVVKEMIGREPFPSVAREEDHGKKIIEALEVAKQVSVPDFNSLVPQAIIKYPTLAQPIKDLQARQDAGGCILQ